MKVALFSFTLAIFIGSDPVRITNMQCKGAGRWINQNNYQDWTESRMLDIAT